MGLKLFMLANLANPAKPMPPTQGMNSKMERRELAPRLFSSLPGPVLKVVTWYVSLLFFATIIYTASHGVSQQDHR
jgi:hypothetical protein